MDSESLMDLQGTLKGKMETVSVMRPSFCEMSEADLRFLVVMLQYLRPRKFLEIGISAGCTTKVTLENLLPESSLFSVDLRTTYYRDIYKPVGHVALESYQSKQYPKWHLLTGVDIAECVDTIGSGIDFMILDTAHALPGEFFG